MALACENVGAPEGTRTPNLLIRSQMLYPLSYGRPAAAVPPASGDQGTGDQRAAAELI
jgi:hypothetical protein